MGKALLLASRADGAVFLDARYQAVAGSTLVTSGVATEANVQLSARVAGTLSGLAVKINATGTSRSIKSRINGADGNQLVTIADTASGLFEDTTHTDTLTAGDKFDVQLSEAGSDPTKYWIRLVFEASSGHACYYASSQGTGFSTDSATTYAALGGAGTASTTEANKKAKARTAGTLTNGHAYVSVNGRSTTTTLKSRINGADGNIALAVGAGLTGLFEDTSNTDAIASGDDVNWSLTNGSGGGSFTAQMLACAIVADTTQNDLFASSNGINRTASGTASYVPLAGRDTATTTESQAQVQHGFAGTASRLRLYVSANTYTGDATVTFRKNAADGNQTITIGAGLTGLFEDASNTDDFDAADECCLKIVGGTANSITWQWWGITEAPVSGVTEEGAASWSGAGTMTGSLSQTLSGAATWAGAGTMTADGLRGQLGAASWSGAGAWAAAGRLDANGAATWSGAGSWAAAAVYTARAAGSWAGAGSWSAAGLRTQYGAALWAGTGSWAGVGKLTARASVAWSGAGTMTATGGVVQLASATFAGVGTMTARGLRVFLAVGKSAGQTISATGQSAGQTVSGWIGQSAAQSGSWTGKDAS